MVDTKKDLNTSLTASVQGLNKTNINSNYSIKAFELIQQGYAVYLLAQGTNSPYKGSNGHLDATTDISVLTDMFVKYGANSNVAITLRDSKIVVLDIDRHTDDKNGLRSLNQAGIKTNFDNEVVETTPRDGLHIFYRVPDGLDVSTLKRNLMSGVELVTDKITVAPSVKNINGELIPYKHFGKELGQASLMPRWLINMASPVVGNTHQKTGNRYAPKYSVPERWEIVLNGFSEGERNSQCMSIAGWLLRDSVHVKTAYEIVQMINNNSSVPLPDREIDTVFTSAYNREKRRRERMNGGAF